MPSVCLVQPYILRGSDSIVRLVLFAWKGFQCQTIVGSSRHSLQETNKQKPYRNCRIRSSAVLPPAAFAFRASVDLLVEWKTKWNNRKLFPTPWDFRLRSGSQPHLLILKAWSHKGILWLFPLTILAMLAKMKSLFLHSEIQPLFSCPLPPTPLPFHCSNGRLFSFFCFRD